MSDMTSAPGWGARAVTTGAVALLLTAIAAIGLAPQAGADFTTAKCAGPNILGRGASFARDAHGVFNFNFKHSYCVGTPGQDTIDVAYDAAGSGAGRTSMKVRNDTPRFGQSDEPPTPTEIEQMDKGTGSAAPSTDTTPGDNGTIHVIPAAIGAVGALVNVPNGCTQADLEAIPTDPAQPVSRTAEQDLDTNSVGDGVIRLRFSKATLEAIWAQGAVGAPNKTWGEVVPAFAADIPNVATCANKPVVRVVRFDESGTTFAFKSYLNTINPARGWLTTYAFGANLTREWPGATFGARNDPTTGCGGTSGPGGGGTELTDNLTSGCSNGNGTLVSTLISTDGSVGYSDISTARNAGQSLAITPRLTGASVYDNDTYWTQVQNGSETYIEPTADTTKGFRTDGDKGANCAGVSFTNVPPSTLDGDWSKTQGVNAPGTKYGICTLSYGLVFDDNAAVWGASPQEEAKARSVKDYWENVVSDGAQGALFGKDYNPLPSGILAISRQGVAEIGWNKAGSGAKPGGGGGGGGNSTPPVGTPVPKAKPSNRFSVPRTTISSKTGTATFSVKLPGAGKLEVLGTARNKGKKVNVGHLTLTVGKAGTYSLTLKPSGAAKALLSEKGKLKVALKFTFTPTDGDANGLPSSVTLKLDQKQ